MKKLLIVGFLCSIGAATFATGLSADDINKTTDLELVSEISVSTEVTASDCYVLETPRFIEAPEIAIATADICYSALSGYVVPSSEDPDPGANQLIVKESLNNLETPSTEIWSPDPDEPDSAPSSVSFLGSYGSASWTVSRLFSGIEILTDQK
jgi:hypothetical protein